MARGALRPPSREHKALERLGHAVVRVVGDDCVRDVLQFLRSRTHRHAEADGAQQRDVVVRIADGKDALQRDARALRDETQRSALVDVQDPSPR